MEPSEYSAVAHEGLAIVNPLSAEKQDRAVELLGLPAGARVLDVGCGKGELLIRIAERWGATGVGVDPSPAYVEHGRAEAARRVGEGRIEFVQALAQDAALEPEGYDLAVNVGASHAFGDYREALAALAGLVPRGGLILYGDGFWRRDPSAEYLAALGASADELPGYGGLACAGMEAGLVPLHAAASSEDDWDRYEWGLLHTAERYAAAHPDEPGVDGLLAWARAGRDRYIGPGGRDTLGFALILFRRA